MYENARARLLLGPRPARNTFRSLSFSGHVHPSSPIIPALHARRADADRQLLDDLLRDLVFGTLVHVVGMNDAHVVPRAHHDVHPGRPGDSRQPQRVPADADGRRVDDRPAARSPEQCDLVDRHVSSSSSRLSIFLNGSYRTHPRFSIVTCSSPRCLALASVEGVYMTHEVDEDVLMRRRHPQSRGVHRPQTV